MKRLTSFPASCIHAADAIAEAEQLVDPRLDQLLRPSCLALADEIQAAGVPPPRLWGILNSLAYQLDNNRELAATARSDAYALVREAAMRALLRIDTAAARPVLRDIGEAVEIHDVDEALLLSCLDVLRARVSRVGAA